MRVFITLLMSSIVAEGTITLSCTPLIPEEGTSSTCTCVNSEANGIQWVKDSTGLVLCPSPGFCLPLSGYNLSSTGAEYSLEILSYTYTSCGIYTCRDTADNNVNDSVTIDMFDFTDTSPTVFQSPPANHSNGKIEIETECLFYKNKNDIKIEWYTVEGNKIERYNTPNGTYPNETACSDTCNNKPAMKMNIGFEHKEEADQSNARNVRFKLVVYHKENPAKKLELTTDNEYSIIKATIPPPGTITTEGNGPNVTSPENPTNNNDSDSTNKILIIGIAVGVGAAVLLGVSVGVCLYCRHKKMKNKQEQTKQSETVSDTKMQNFTSL